MHHILTNRSEIESQFLELLERNITSLTDLIKWIDDSDSIEAKLQNDFAWRYIHQTTHTNNEQYKSEYENFLQTIYPNWIQISDKIGRKLIDNEFVSELPTTYHNLIRSTKHAIELYREENVPLLSQQQAIESEYSELIGAMSVEYKGEILTMAQAAQYLKNPDRSIRKELFELMEQRRKSDAEKFDDILTRLIHIRTEIAKNCGFESYTQYAYSRRFDYTQSQIHTFHKSIQQVITPL